MHMVEDIKQFISEFETSRYGYVFREANRVIDYVRNDINRVTDYVNELIMCHVVDH